MPYYSASFNTEMKDREKDNSQKISSYLIHFLLIEALFSPLLKVWLKHFKVER